MNVVVDPNDSTSAICRICFEPMNDLNIENYCKCKGTIGNVHRECLIKYLEFKGEDHPK